MRDTALISDLENAAGVPDIYSTCKSMTEKLGFAYFVYAVRIPVSITQPYHFSISGYPQAWRTRYNEQGYLTVDPVVAHVLTSLKPLIWDQIAAPGERAEEFFRDASEHGLGHGITIPVYGRGGEVSLLSVARPEPITKNHAQRVALVQRLQYFATHVHEAVRNVILNPEGDPIVGANLSSREKECLVWAAEGNASWEIARILDISERTVNFHLQNASEKLGVQGSRNAVAKAIALGEIETPAYTSDPWGRIPLVYWHSKPESVHQIN